MAKKKEHKSIKWSFPEYARHERQRGWYFWSILISLGIIVYAILTGNWLFALIIIMFGIIIVINHHNQPEEMKFEIDHDGIKLNGKLYKYDEINRFWIIYQPPEVKNLYFDMKSPFRPRLSIPLGKENPVDIKAFLRQYLEEDLDEEQEPFSETFGRLFKL